VLVLSVDQVLAFGLTALVVIAIPGPSVVFVIGRALAYGRPVALASVLGNALGQLTIVVLVAVGLGVVVQESLTVFVVLKVAGAAYLVWLGVEAVRRRREFLGADPVLLGVPMTARRAIRQGYLVGVSNPKGFLLLGAVLPQFVHRAEGHIQLQMLLLGLLANGIGLLSDSVWAVVASQLRAWFARSPRRGEAMGTAGGLSMIGVGLALVLSGDPH
jgi:threonine/homoserine/homoserine lactone efflux protein